MKKIYNFGLNFVVSLEADILMLLNFLSAGVFRKYNNQKYFFCPLNIYLFNETIKDDLNSIIYLAKKGQGL